MQGVAVDARLRRPRGNKRAGRKREVFLPASGDSVPYRKLSGHSRLNV